jgi:hypothetical protein
LDAVQELIDELESDALAPALTLTIAQLYRFATEIEDAVKRTNDFIAAAGIA